jgi:superfamily I DNA and RNA helicase
MWYNEVSTLLKPPYHAIEQGQKIKLNQKQKQISKPLSNTHMRVRGVAGSGKTLVLAQRAADLANNGMNVLVVTFNITIWHYVRDMVSRARYGFSWEKISFDYYHNFCKSFLLENDVDIPWPSIKGESPTPKEIEYEQLFFSQVFPQLVIDTYDSGKNRKNRKYDAIIIDEGQDFNKIFYHSLTKFLSENDELLIAFDNRQNIFERDASWLENAKDTRFRGKWRELNECYRLPEEILISLNNFAEKFIPEASQHPVPQQYQTEAFIPKMVWQNTKNYNSAEKVIETAVDWLMFKKKCHPSDIIILTPNHKEGMQLVRTFNRKSNRNRIYSVNHVFSDNPRWDKRNKKSFWMGDGRLKMSTIHSFKGWELLNIVLLTPEGYGKDEGNIDSLMYTAMSRTLQNLVVVNRMDKYWDYGKSWDTKFS